ncbi:MAG TPA: multiple monosaccharide ABC transporter ATP-binding protein [Pseudogracilibacillus sp.]|nr:multiple monosaccharide ABC transporter ATP-binding protein [Pseudogracilibacillus sp.]
MSDILLRMENITKEFPGVKALENVNFEVKKGEIHALIGENGAGKSTLMKVLSGIHPHGSYSGNIVYEDNVCEFKDVNDSEDKGIIIVHQELALIPELSIAENIFLGNERGSKGVVNWRETIKETRELMERVGLVKNPQDLIKDIGVGHQQLVEIAKALSKRVKLLILDEPTAALNEEESENLLNLLLEFKKQGMTSIMISHKLKELFKVSDSITVIRDGQTISSYNLHEDDVNEELIIRDMVGRSLSNMYPDRPKFEGDEIKFEVKDWNVHSPQNADWKVIDNASFNVKKGEIVGIAGLMGAGRTELAMSIFGQSYGKNISGEAFIDGQAVNLKDVDKAIKNGIAYVSEDRKEYGLILMYSVRRNLMLADLSRISKRGIINSRIETREAEKLRESMNIKTPSIEQETMNLSGGNQQKVVLGKWMFTEPEILILDEPTRGIDVGAKSEIYKIINELAEMGKSIIMISSELPELLGMCDRIYTLCEGHITGEHLKENTNQEKLMVDMTHVEA